MFEKIAIILLVNFLLYFKTLRYSYVSDDIPVYKKTHQMFKDQKKVDGHGKLKLTLKNWLWLRWQQFIGAVRVAPPEDHLLTMVIHALVSVGILTAFQFSYGAFLSALLFSVNPLNNQGSIWISGRGYALPALCILYSLAFPVLAPALLLLSASFTVGYIAPLCALGTILSGSTLYFLVLPIVWLIWWKKFFKAVKFKGDAETVIEDRTLHPRKLILMTKTIGWYLFNCIIPHRIAFFHNFLQSCAGNEIMKARAYSLCRFFWIGVALIGGFIAYSILVPWNIIHIGLLWFFIGILPFSNLKRNNQEIADRFCYIANIGLMVAVGAILSHFPVVAYMMISLYVGVMWTVMGMYKDDYWIIEFSVMNDPFAWFAWHTRAMKRWDNKSYKEALVMWVMAKMLSPKEFKLLFNIAVVLRILNNQAESEEFLKLAEKNIIAGQEETSNFVIQQLRRGNARMLM